MVTEETEQEPTDQGGEKDNLKVEGKSYITLQRVSISVQFNSIILSNVLLHF